jgi:oxygen-independent coproporphyrinogen-3 oxidase
VTDPIYVHVPFCNGKCAYCAFASVVFTPAGADAYLQALESELALEPGAGGERPAPPETVYVGGGTPTVLPLPQLERLLASIRSSFDLSRLREWTVEATPDTLTPDKAAALRAAGVTRVSLGAQAFDDRTLAAIGRRHCAADIALAVARCRDAGFAEIGLDLIAGLPGADSAAWSETLDRAVALAPTHLSVYALSIEPGSRWHAQPEAQRRAPDEDLVIRRLRRAEARLNAAGFVRYEVSNFAQPGHECRHNQAIWRGADYLGFGPAAASRRAARRWTNRPDPDAYAAAARAGIPPPRESETLSSEADIRERLAFAFRCRDGLDLAPFCRRFAVPAELADACESTLTSLSAQRLVTRSGSRWTPTRRGLAFADTIAAALL